MDRAAQQPDPPAAFHEAIARPRLTQLALGSLAVTLLSLSGCDFPGRPDPADQPVLESAQLNFNILYDHNCAGCHGAEGKLGPAPPLDDPLFLAIVPDDELLRVITDGRAGTPMPPFTVRRGGPLTDAQIRSLAQGIKQRWTPGPTTPDVPSYASSLDANDKSNAARAERGLVVYARACAECHGADGEGADEGGTPGRINDRAFLTLVSDQMLRRIVITGRPDLGMPSYAEDIGRVGDFQPLTTTEIDELVALLVSWRAGEGQRTNTQRQATQRQGTH